MPDRSPLRLKGVIRHHNPSKRRTHTLANTEPHEPDGLYRQVFEQTHTIKLIINPLTAQIVEANPAACQFYGYTYQRLTTLRLTDISTLSESQIQTMLHDVTTTKSREFTTHHRLASGVVREVEVHCGVVNVDDIAYVYVIIHDITADLQAESAKYGGEDLYRLFARNMPNSSVTMFDTALHFTLVEGPFLRQLGYSAESIVGKKARETLPDETFQFMLPIYERALQGEVFSYERETENYAYTAYVTPVRDANGHIVGGMILSHDITHRKRLEEALRDREEHLQLVTDNVQDLVTQSDADDRLIFVSPSCRSMLGFEPEDMLGKFRHEFIAADWEFMIAARNKAIEQRLQQITIEGYLRHSDGHHVHVETVGKLLYDTQSNYAGAVYITRDITARKHLQNLQVEKEKLQAALEKEQELSTLKTRMMERIAHEFRTPLAVIQASVEMLLEFYEQLTPDQKAAKTTTVKGQIRRITDMLDEIGLVMKASSTPTGLWRLPTNLASICRELSDNLATHFNLPDKYVLIISEPVVAEVDPTLIRNALLHILRNAAVFSPPSAPVYIHLSHVEDMITVHVTDTGIGILPEELPRIFEPFFRGSNIDERGGLGIGLSIARAAVEAHGGSITVQSVLGQQTTFTVSIPA